MFHGSYPNTSGLVTAPVGLPSLLPSLLPTFLSLCLSWWPTHPQLHQPTSPLLLTCHQSHCPGRLSSANLRSLHPTLLFHAFPTPSDLVSPPGFERLCQGFMFTLLLHRLCCRLGQASCCSSNSIVLNGDVGRIKLVIFQGWSVLGRYAIREC